MFSFGHVMIGPVQASRQVDTTKNRRYRETRASLLDVEYRHIAFGLLVGVMMMMVM